MKKNYLLIAFTFSLVSCLKCNAQKIASDSKGKSVFSNYALEDYKFDISTDEPFSISFSLARFISTINNKVLKPTISSDTDIFFNYALLNSSDQLDFNNLRENKFGSSFKIGIQKNVKSLGDAKNFKFFKGGGGLSFFYEADNLSYYDSQLSSESTTKPISYGLELNANIFPKANLNFSKLNFITAIEAQFYLRTWNKDELLNYQLIKDVETNVDVIAFEDFRGKYGVLDNNVKKIRLAISEPIFYKRMNLTPYAVLNATSNNKPEYRVGSNVNLTQAQLNRNDINFEGSFGIGIDWGYNSDNWSKANIFLRGSISLVKYENPGH